MAVVNGEPITAEALARELRQTRAGGEGEAPGRRCSASGSSTTWSTGPCCCSRPGPAPSWWARTRWSAPSCGCAASTPARHFDDLLAQERLSQAELKARLQGPAHRGAALPRGGLPARPGGRRPRSSGWYAEHAGRVRASRSGSACCRWWWRPATRRPQLRDKLRRDPSRLRRGGARQPRSRPEGKNGGDLGWIGRGAGFPEVFDVCFSLPLNAVSDVTPSPYGFHLFRVVERKAASRRTLEQARAEIARAAAPRQAGPRAGGVPGRPPRPRHHPDRPGGPRRGDPVTHALLALALAAAARRSPPIPPPRPPRRRRPPTPGAGPARRPQPRGRHRQRRGGDAARAGGAGRRRVAARRRSCRPARSATGPWRWCCAAPSRWCWPSGSSTPRRWRCRSR